jgi:hypothetical protein
VTLRVNNKRILPVPHNRVLLHCIDFIVPDLTKTNKYENRLTFRCREYAAVLVGECYVSRFELRSCISEGCVLMPKRMVYLLRSPEGEGRKNRALPLEIRKRCWEFFEISSYA